MIIRWRPRVLVGSHEAIYLDCALPFGLGEIASERDRLRGIEARSYLLGRVAGRIEARDTLTSELARELARIEELQGRAERTLAELFELAQEQARARARCPG